MGERATVQGGARVHHEVGAVGDGPAIAAHRPHDHPVLIEDAGVLQLPLVSIPEGDIGGMDQRRVSADCQQPQLGLCGVRTARYLGGLVCLRGLG